MFQLDFGDHRPLYEQIQDKLKELIINGVLKEGDKIPSVRELAQSLTINPNTIQKAYKDLEADGYIYSQRSKGSFVAPQSGAALTEKKDKLFIQLEELIREMAFLNVNAEEITQLTDRIYKEV